MATAQPGIFALGNRSQYHLEYSLKPGCDVETLRRAIARVWIPEDTPGGMNVVVGLSRGAWALLSTEGVPGSLTDFEAITGADGRFCPSTQFDLWIWLQGTGTDRLYGAAREVDASISPHATLGAELATFEFEDGRDLTGFVDGSENPKIGLRGAAAIVADGETGEGGSFAVVQKWVHDLAAFDALPVAEQEKVFGRTKQNDVEFDDDAKPPTAHNVRNVIEDEEGNELEIWRRNSRFGGIECAGAMFVGFSCEPGRTELMLRRMFNAVGDGLHDAFTDFSLPVTGSRYFVPSIEAAAAAFGLDTGGDPDFGASDPSPGVGSLGSGSGNQKGRL